jgi:hypothetical protein
MSNCFSAATGFVQLFSIMLQLRILYKDGTRVYKLQDMETLPDGFHILDEGVLISF